MSEVQELAPAEPLDRETASAAGLSAQIGMVARRQEELAQVVQQLNASVADFDQLRGYVEQMGEILANLAREVTALDPLTIQRRLDDLAETVSQVSVLQAEVAATDQPAPDPAPVQGGPASWWPDLATRDDRAEALQSLGTWVDEVLRNRHPEMYNQLGSCWYQHPDILDELTALRAAWFAAYRDPAAPATAAIEWHDRWLPGAMRRCRGAIRARGCKARHEKVMPATDPFLDRQEFVNFVRLSPGPDGLLNEATPANMASPPWEPATEPVPLIPDVDPVPPPE
jgi:hypothetical protein